MALVQDGKVFGLSRIILAKDLTSDSDAAIDYVRVLAQKFQALVLIVHIINDAVGTSPVTAARRLEMLEMRSAKMKDLQRIKSNLAGAGIQTREILYEGHPVSAVLAMLARQRKADLIVIAASAQSVESNKGGISIFEDIMLASRYPFFVVGDSAIRSGASAELAKVLYLDSGLEEQSESARFYAQEFARNAGAVLFTVETLSCDFTLDGLVRSVPKFRGEAEMQCVEDAAEQFNASLLICRILPAKHPARQAQWQLLKSIIMRISHPVLILPG